MTIQTNHAIDTLTPTSGVLTVVGGIVATQARRLRYDVQVPVTGFSITAADDVDVLVLDPAGLLLTGTLTLPAGPADGQALRLRSTQAVTALTLAPNAGQSVVGGLTTLAAQGGAQYLYEAAGARWFRID